MKTFKFDNYKVTAKKRNGNSNYELAVHLYKDGILESGTILKTTCTEVDVLEWALASINNPYDLQINNLQQLER